MRYNKCKIVALCRSMTNDLFDCTNPAEIFLAGLVTSDNYVANHTGHLLAVFRIVLATL